MSGNGEEQQTEGGGKKQTSIATDTSNSQTQGQETSGLEQGISKLGHEDDSASPTSASASTAAHAPTQEAQHDIIAATEHHEPNEEKKDKRPRDSKGWDGKLRLPKKTVGAGEGSPEPESGDEDEESGKEDEDVGGPITRGVVRVEREEGPAPEELEADEDLLEGVDSDEEDIDLVHCKIRSLPALKLGVFKRLKRLCLRQNQITTIELPEELGSALEDLDLYDNLISHIKGLDAFTELTSLDLSFNKIKHIKRINHLTKLRDLYFVQNKISTIEGLDGLVNLRNLELGANRIREITNLETLTSLEELWLGKNKITQISGLSTLSNLKILSIQSNRLTQITGLDSLTSLEELHISYNQLTSLSGLDHNTNLRVIDISANPIEHLEGLKHLSKLEELWASNTLIANFTEVERELADKEELQTVYFEGTPLQKASPVLYRNKVRLALPRVRQIDATYVKG